MPAASGGLWDRASAVQAFDGALRAGDADAVAETLPDVWEAMREARLGTPFAQQYAPQIAEMPLGEAMAGIVFEIGLLGPDYEAVALEHTPRNARDALLVALARGMPEEARPESPPEDPIPLALMRGFTDQAPPETLARMIEEDRAGEVILRAISLIDEGRAGDTGALAEGLATLRAVGLEDPARRIALQLLLLEYPA
ncbi:hypothetical protein [Limimaricola sp.]|uniref:hypothetical protein n=1 Tax=Limimaricola sp. TaxID=2211665 RepID=UPI0040591392